MSIWDAALVALVAALIVLTVLLLVWPDRADRDRPRVADIERRLAAESDEARRDSDQR